MQTIGQVLNEQQMTNGERLVHISKSYSEMTAEERRAYSQKRCDLHNTTPGSLNEKDGYDCPDCLNRGYMYVVQEIERGEQTNDFNEAIRACHCKPIRASIMRMKRSGLESVMQKYTFDRYAAAEPWQKHIKDTAQRFVNNGNVFFIGGQTGAGKTHICTAITVEFLRQGKAAYYMLWADETVRLKACIMESPEYQQQMKKLKEVEVLYIDDFMKPVGDQKTPSAADIRLAYELINYRYNNAGLITVISSERLIGEILDIDEATGGRLVEYAGEYMINIGRDKGRNYRLRNTGLI